MCENFKTKKIRIQADKIAAYCNECGGEFGYVMNLSKKISKNKKVLHRCNKCYDEVILPDRYPMISTWEEVGD